MLQSESGATESGSISSYANDSEIEMEIKQDPQTVTVPITVCISIMIGWVNSMLLMWCASLWSFLFTLQLHSTRSVSVQGVGEMGLLRRQLLLFYLTKQYWLRWPRSGSCCEFWFHFITGWKHPKMEVLGMPYKIFNCMTRKLPLWAKKRNFIFAI